MELTYNQWRKAKISELKKEYPNAEKHAMQMTIDTVADNGSYFELCIQHVKGGGVLKRAVLDCMESGQRYRIFHDFPNFLDKYHEKFGVFYVNPEKRALSHAH
jgi:hypothetical protein